MTGNWKRRDQEGAAAVEFALVVPLLLLLVFAIISFGFLFAQNLALDNAARQTARYAVIQDRTCADVKAEALDAASPLVHLTDADVTIALGTEDTASDPATTICGSDADQPCDGSPADSNVYVKLDYTANVLIPVVPGMGSTMDLSGEGVFRCEWN